LFPAVWGFEDRALEDAFWRSHASRRLSHLRVSIALLMLFSIAFYPVESYLFPIHATSMHQVRAVIVAGQLVVAPWVFGPWSTAALTARSQVILLYLTLVTTAPLLVMHAMVVGDADDVAVLGTLMAAIFCLICIFCGSGLRFAFAAPLATVGCAVYLGVLGGLGHTSTSMFFAVAAFLLGEWTLGSWVCWSIERANRQDFLRGRELGDALARTEALLLNLMPETFAVRRMAGRETLDRLSQATVVFATLVGFEEATASLSPIAAVRLLDRLVARFDELAEQHGVERIKTIGATYMAAAGVPAANGSDAAAAARLALAMREVVRDFAAAESLSLQLRVGLATGPVVAGVIGRTRPAFDCWGDTANLASRLDSHGEPDRVQLSAATASALGAGFVVTRRGPVFIKGKGDLVTHWLDAEAA
jgi:class 3 adenylate cyclase